METLDELNPTPNRNHPLALPLGPGPTDAIAVPHKGL